MSYSDYESVIGLEIHAQLSTKSKLFCSCSTEFGGADNENTCPICLGMPGTLPVVNALAIEYAIKIGLSLNCTVNHNSVFARKNYFYPDLSKGYQISQFEKPIAEKGEVQFYLNGERRKVGITRAHIEEDAGKSIHQGDSTLVNYNRSSVPLVEIVSDPVMTSPQEAAEYARTVRSILLYLGVCDGNLEEGSMRCDCNVSVRKKNEAELGTRTELKNINSFRFIEKAIQYEIERQIDLLESGDKVVQETRLYDSAKNKTLSMRSKEEAHDYRYFPDPDLLAIPAPSNLVKEIESKMPELPVEKAERFCKSYQVTSDDAFVLTQSREMAQYFEDVVSRCEEPRLAVSWVIVELLGKLNDSKLEISESPVGASALGDLLSLIKDGTISGKIAKTVFSTMYEKGGSALEIVESQGLKQISDDSALIQIIEEVIETNPDQVAQYKSGKEKVFGFFVGQVMKLTKGQANPAKVNDLLKEKLS